jgi:hypothetical protein
MVFWKWQEDSVFIERRGIEQWFQSQLVILDLIPLLAPGVQGCGLALEDIPIQSTGALLSLHHREGQSGS